MGHAIQRESRSEVIPKTLPNDLCQPFRKKETQNPIKWPEMHLSKWPFHDISSGADRKVIQLLNQSQYHCPDIYNEMQQKNDTCRRFDFTRREFA